MNTNIYEEAKKNMELMSFTEEEKEIVMSDEFFIEGVAKDPDYYSKEYFEYIARLSCQ